MTCIGFSTGALAKGDYRRGIELQLQHRHVCAIELSALREHELPSLAASAPYLPLSAFRYVSFHAPSKLQSSDENAVFELLLGLPKQWPLIVHPELLRTRELWSQLGSRMCLENMDNRKTSGRTVAEMRMLFDVYPDAGFCLDLGHARQIDPTMATTIRMLKEFSGRLRQIHVSELGPRSEHRAMSNLALYAFELVADLVPESCPLILESVVSPEEIDTEIEKTLYVFANRAVRKDRSLRRAGVLAR